MNTNTLYVLSDERCHERNCSATHGHDEAGYKRHWIPFSEPLYRLCPHCEGEGFCKDVAYRGPGEPYEVQTECSTCKQLGFVRAWPKDG